MEQGRTARDTISNPSPTIGWVELVVGFLVTTILGTAFFAFLITSIDNTSINTTNGLWKSTEIRKWAESQTGRVFDPANLLYYPVNGTLVGWMPESWFGPVFKRLAYLNGAFAGLSLGFLYVLLRGLALSRAAAVCAIVFQAGCGFFLIDAIINEDVMAPVAMLMAASAAAVFLLPKGNLLGIFVTAQLFTLSWLFEWRFMFPSLPAFLVTLFLLGQSWGQRLRNCSLFLASCLVLPAILARLPIIHNHWWFSFRLILWTGKGVSQGQATGWGGFTWNKVGFLGSGISHYVYRGANVDDVAYLWSPGYVSSWLTALVLVSLLGFVFVCAVARKWNDPTWRTAGLLLGGTFLFGEFFNLYSQPQDPQMQLNVMIWVVVAWAMACQGILSLFPRGGGLVALPLIGLSLMPLGINLPYLETLSGEDSRQMRMVAEVKEQIDLDRTVLIFNGFEGQITWFHVADGIDWYQTWAQSVPGNGKRFRFMYLLDQATWHPKRSAEVAAASVRSQIDRAVVAGYRVLVNKTWEMSEKDFASSWSTVADESKPLAVFRSLKASYQGVKVFDTQSSGPYYQLTPIPGAPSYDVPLSEKAD